MKAKIYIGCSGYYYPSWRGKFYPAQVKQKDWLKYYSTIFKTVELNSTFYHLPKLAALKTVYSATEKSFRFSVKMSRFVTHIRRLKNCENEIADFHALVEDGLGDKLACVLYQMPPSFIYTPENAEAIVESVPSSPFNVVELRHQSWWNEDVVQLFKKAKITFCNVDFPGLVTPINPTSPVFYLRLHGKPKLFISSYSTKRLTEFSRQIPANSSNAYIYFNNSAGGAAIKNAAELIGVKNEIF